MGVHQYKDSKSPAAFGIKKACHAPPMLEFSAISNAVWAGFASSDGNFCEAPFDWQLALDCARTRFPWALSSEKSPSQRAHDTQEPVLRGIDLDFLGTSPLDTHRGPFALPI